MPDRYAIYNCHDVNKMGSQLHEQWKKALNSWL